MGSRGVTKFIIKLIVKKVLDRAYFPMILREPLGLLSKTSRIHAYMGALKVESPRLLLTVQAH